MKTKETNSINDKRTRKKKLNAVHNVHLNKSVFKRREQEVYQIVVKENELSQNQKEQGTSVSFQCLSEGSSSITENHEGTSEDEKNFREFRLKEKRKVMEEAEVISRIKAESALDMLKTESKSSKDKLTNDEKRLNMLKKHCNKTNFKWPQDSEHTWESAMYIVKTLRTCILTRNWNNITYLLLLLLKHNKKYVSYVKQVALLNLIDNPLDYNNEILEELHKLCIVALHR